MPTVYFKNAGEVLLVAGAVALGPDCCCGGGGGGECPEITLVCDSITASKSKCGYVEFGTASTPPKRYRVRTTTFGSSSTLNDPGSSYSCTSTLSTLRTDTYDENCSLSCASSGSGSVVDSDTGTHPITVTGCKSSFNPTDAPVNPPNTESKCGCDFTTSGFAFCPPTCPITYVTTGPTTLNTHITWGVTGHGAAGYCGPFPSESYDYAASFDCLLSSEYSTSDLIAETEAALPSYDNDYNDDCSAIFDLSMTAYDLTLQNFKPKWTFSSSPIDFVIGYNEHFVSADMMTITDTPRTISVSMGQTEALGSEVIHPGSNGAITISDVTCTPA